MRWECSVFIKDMRVYFYIYNNVINRVGFFRKVGDFVVLWRWFQEFKFIFEFGFRIQDFVLISFYLGRWRWERGSGQTIFFCFLYQFFRVVVGLLFLIVYILFYSCSFGGCVFLFLVWFRLGQSFFVCFLFYLFTMIFLRFRGMNILEILRVILRL